MIYHGTITMENGAELPFELYPDDAPATVENFVKLVKEGYYDGKTFHRVIKNFVSQGGCPYGTGAGDLGYTIPCETENNPHKHEDGSLSRHTAARIQAAASSLSATVRSRIWMAYIPYSAR